MEVKEVPELTSWVFQFARLSQAVMPVGRVPRSVNVMMNSMSDRGSGVGDEVGITPVMESKNQLRPQHIPLNLIPITTGLF
jgi:hypothetical protein